MNPKHFVASKTNSNRLLAYLPDMAFGNHSLSNLHNLSFSFYSKQQENRSIRWSLPDSFRVPYDNVITNKANEHLKTGTQNKKVDEYVAALGPLTVSGVYLHLYISSPGWALRHPEIFLNGVMEKWIEVRYCLREPNHGFVRSNFHSY